MKKYLLSKKQKLQKSFLPLFLMTTIPNSRKRRYLKILLFFGILFSIKINSNVNAQTYDSIAVQRINDLIYNNGLQATPNAPETWTFAAWNYENPKQLTYLYVGWLGLTGIASFANLTALEQLFCDVNNLTEIDLTNCNSLKTLSCYGNNLTKLDVTSCKKLDRISFDKNKITEIDLTHSDRWWIIDGNYCSLTGLDLSKFGYIKYVEVDEQNVSLILNENETGEYTHSIYLNTPTFNQSPISYTEGILTSTDSTVRNSNFEVKTGNDYYKVRGTMNFSYIPLGIKTPENHQPNIYPNPVKDIFFIECETFNWVILYDIQGKAVLNQSANSKTEINISRLPNGVYIVNAFSEYKIIGKTKIVKQ